MKKKELSQKQRVLAAFLYIIIITTVYGLLNGGINDYYEGCDKLL